MRGTVIKRGKTWSFVADIGRDENDKRLRRWSSGHRTKKDAQQALNDFLHGVRRGADPAPSDVTLRDDVPRWMRHSTMRVNKPIRAKTAERYLDLLEDHVLPHLGHMKLATIRPRHIEPVLETMKARPLSARTIMQARAVLGALMQRALVEEIIDSNPVRATTPPNLERPRLKVPTPEQIAALISQTKDTPWEIPIMLAGTTGARRSEVLGIRWDDVDLKSGDVRIERGLHRVKKEGGGTMFVMLPPKSASGQRTVRLQPVALERLRRYRQEQTARRLALGPAWFAEEPFDGLVCERGDGRPCDPDGFTDAFKRLAARAGFDPATRLHDLRHGIATALGRQGIHGILVAAWLGHADPGFTMRTYQHAWGEGTSEAAAAIGNALGGAER